MEGKRLNKSESKYYNTACLMDEAFILLLEKKEYKYITIKEICEKAGVNRSTFYLHYETLGDLLMESIDYIHKQFYDYMLSQNIRPFVDISNTSTNDLYLITPQYLIPYLEYIKRYRRLFGTAVKNDGLFRLEETYERMFQRVFNPILEKFRIPASKRRYIMAFYIHGLSAIINEWLKNDCQDTIEEITSIMQKCVESSIVK